MKDRSLVAFQIAGASAELLEILHSFRNSLAKQSNLDFASSFSTDGDVECYLENVTNQSNTLQVTCTATYIICGLGSLGFVVLGPAQACNNQKYKYGGVHLSDGSNQSSDV